MTSITITLPDKVMNKLNELAKRHQTVPEEYLRAKIEELVESTYKTDEKKSIQEIINFVDQTYGKYAGDDSVLDALLKEKALDRALEKKKFSVFNG